MPGPYEGVHGFVFLHEEEGDPDPGRVVERLREELDPDNGPVFFASLFDGDFAGFGHFAADDTEQLVDFIESVLFEEGVRSDYATEGAVHESNGQKRGPKRRSPRYCAICRIRCALGSRPKAVLNRISEEFNDRRPFMGGARVIGRFQLLVELGSNFEDKLDLAIERVGAVDGVDTMEWAKTDTGDDDGEPEDSD